MQKQLPVNTINFSSSIFNDKSSNVNSNKNMHQALNNEVQNHNQPALRQKNLHNQIHKKNTIANANHQIRQLEPSKVNHTQDKENNIIISNSGGAGQENMGPENGAVIRSQKNLMGRKKPPMGYDQENSRNRRSQSKHNFDALMQ